MHLAELIKPYIAINPIVHITLCTHRKDSLRELEWGFCISRKIGTGGGGTGGGGWGHPQGAVHIVVLGLAVKGSCLGPRGPALALTAWTGLENTTLTLQGVGF